MGKQDGGSVFPELTNVGGQKGILVFTGGMSLRDYFAVHAVEYLGSFLARNSNKEWPNGLAEEAYKIADAMLAERSKDA